MKKIYLLTLACLFACFDMQAQISITSDDMAALGLSKGLSSSRTVGDLSSGDASDEAQTWDFSSLEAEDNSLLLYSPVAGTIAEDDFPLAEFTRTASVSELLGLDLEALLIDLIGAQQIPPATAYYTTNGEGSVFTQGFNAEINVPGIADLGATTLPANPADLLMSPIEFGETVSNEGQFALTVDIEALPIPITITIDVDRTMTADAFGTVDLPSASYEALRVNELMDINVNAVIFDTAFSVQFFKFFAEGEGHPIATIRGVDPGPTSTPEQIEWVGEIPPGSIAFDYVSNCLDVNFQNNSEFLVDYVWDLGDGTIIESPVANHSYEEYGTYQVTLTASDLDGESFTETVEVVLDCPLSVGYDSSVDCLTGEANFSNSSENWSSISWDFGDGESSEEISPTHTYAESGSYDVVLTVVGINGDTEEVTQTVVYENCALVAGFEFEIECPDVIFTNMSENATNYFWDFGDGNGSGEANPTHQYALSGTYTVQLSASAGALSESYSTEVTIDCPVSNEDLVGAGFRAFPNPTSGMFTIRTDELLSAGSQLSIYNAVGALVKEVAVGNQQEITTDLSNLNAGLYFYVIADQAMPSTMKGKVLVD